MFKRKKRHQYLNSYYKPPTSMKINKIINQVFPDNDNKPKNTGISDSDGLTKAYDATNAIYVDGNKMYVAGTRSFGEALRDWWKIPAGKTTEIERYGQLTEALKNNPQVDTIIGHSLGSSALAELQKQTDNKYLARYYGAPFWNINPFDAPDPRNQTFRHPGDPISAFDHNAVDIPANNFDTWLWSHGYSGFPDDKIPKSYRNDFSSFNDTDNSNGTKKKFSSTQIGIIEN